MMLYRSNVSLCSQPQYVDIFAELQGQMQKIEAQLHIKYAQLNGNGNRISLGNRLQDTISLGSNHGYPSDRDSFTGIFLPFLYLYHTSCIVCFIRK